MRLISTIKNRLQSPVRRVKAQYVLTTTDIVGQRNVITITAGFDNSLLLLSTEKTPDYRIVAAGGASFSKHRAATPNHFHIHRYHNSEMQVLDLSETDENYHFVQMLGPTRWLLVRSRSEGRTDLNAHIYSASGERLHSFYAGDGIEDVQTTADGQIWVSYFDEGVYSGDELSHNGLVAFNAEGEVTWTYRELPGWPQSLPPIDDCYALNVVSNNEVYLYYYSDFPLVRLQGRDLAQWWPQVPVHGASALAVHTGRALFARGYDEPHTLFLVSLLERSVKKAGQAESLEQVGKWEPVEKMQAVDESGDIIEFTRAFARGWILYLIRESDVFSINLSEL